MVKSSRLGINLSLWLLLLLLLLSLLHWHWRGTKLMRLRVLPIVRLAPWEASVLGLQRRWLLIPCWLRLKSYGLLICRKASRLHILLLRKAIWLLVLIIGVELLLRGA